jgi:hypothetical protein
MSLAGLSKREANGTTSEKFYGQIKAGAKSPDMHAQPS